MHELIAHSESWWDRFARWPAILYLGPLSLFVTVASVAAWLVPTVSYEQASVTQYELRYVEGVGNVEYPAGSRKARVRLFEPPSSEEAIRRLPGFLACGAFVGLLGGAALHVRCKRLYKNGRRVYFKDGDLLPITGEPMQGELLPPIRAIELDKSATEGRTIVNQSYCARRQPHFHGADAEPPRSRPARVRLRCQPTPFRLARARY